MLDRLRFIIKQKKDRMARNIPFLFEELKEDENALLRLYGLPITRLDIVIAIIGIYLLFSYGFK
ncbi:hypothetical protein [Campylobacter concisus]|jgi:hypothetical protein|uniref:hypothetical protein n=1 Tax=Campylobacter concisus TaxID=199 RepID=UPI0011E81014|nr:hypothetical protein [Campylobacter concisus]MBE9856407.1 hypothetical protein [Campylobacter concisus]